MKATLSTGTNAGSRGSYHLSANDDLRWEEADAYCKKRGQKLAIPTDSAEFNAITGMQMRSCVKGCQIHRISSQKLRRMHPTEEKWFVGVWLELNAVDDCYEQWRWRNSDEEEAGRCCGISRVLSLIFP